MLWEENFVKSAYSSINNHLSVRIPSQTINFSIAKSFNWYFTRSFYNGSLQLINHDHVKLILNPAFQLRVIICLAQFSYVLGDERWDGLKIFVYYSSHFSSFPFGSPLTVKTSIGISLHRRS